MGVLFGRALESDQGKTVLLQESGGRGRVLGNVHDAPVEILRLLNSSLNFVPEPVMARW